jgi:hypothetical protein
VTQSPAKPPATTAVARAIRFGDPVADRAARAITTGSDGSIGMNPSMATPRKRITYSHGEEISGIR